MAGYFFTSLIAYPGMMFLLGREAREKREHPSQIRYMGLGLIVLSFLQKTLLFWVETCLGREPNFYPFSTSGAPWMFMVGGMGLILVSFYRERKWTGRWLVPLTVLAGLGIGLIKVVGDFLCLSRLVVYLPFLILGFLVEEETIERLSGKVWLKAAGAVAVLGWAGFCLIARAQLSDFRLLVDNNKWYKACAGLSRILAGIPARGLFYAAALVLLISLLALTPGKKLAFISEQGKRWKSGYFWFAPAAYLIVAPLSGKSSWKDLALAGVLGLVLLLISSSRGMNKLPYMLQNWTDYTQPKTPTSKELAGGSFYQRHRWGIQMLVLFSCCFGVAVIGFVYPYFSNGKNLVWAIDGLQQQYPALLYTGNYIREMLGTLVETGELVFPQWDFSIGFGLAPVEVLRREPLSLLLIFVTEENLEAFYNCFVVLRMYLCGLAFVWYCWELGKRQKLPIAMGAMVFLFSDFILLKAVRQPFFLTTLMTYFLLILVGVERYLRKGKPAFFVGIVALALFSDYYCAYINSLLMAVYLLCRLYGMYGTDIKKIVTKIVKMIGWYLWGAVMSLCTLLPCLMAFLSSARSGEGVDIELFYNNSYYSKLLSGLGMGYGGLGYRSYVGFASIGLLACILLFLKRKKSLRPLKIGLCAVTVFICLPVFGSILNGFSYVTNRWCFAIAFVVAITLVEMAPEFANMTPRERKYMAITVLVYSALVLTQESTQRDGVYIGVAVLGMSTVVVLMLKEFFTNRRAQMGALAVITTLNACFVAAAAGLPEFGDYAGQNIDTDAADNLVVNYMSDAVDALEADDSFYRVGRPFSQTNQSLMVDYNGVSAYYSVIAAQL
ncbi:MAG: YfhO family protein, partial [Oscillospiraceae bacterium]|nr:YfhO family protein [Oscillospiraceae bacterium]